MSLKKSDFPFVTDTTAGLHPANLSGNATNALCQVSGKGYFEHHVENPSPKTVLNMLKGHDSYSLLACKNIGKKTVLELVKFVKEHI